MRRKDKVWRPGDTPHEQPPVSGSTEPVEGWIADQNGVRSVGPLGFTVHTTGAAGFCHVEYLDAGDAGAFPAGGHQGSVAAPTYAELAHALQRAVGAAGGHTQPCPARGTTMPCQCWYGPARLLVARLP